MHFGILFVRGGVLTLLQIKMPISCKYSHFPIYLMQLNITVFHFVQYFQKPHFARAEFSARVLLVVVSSSSAIRPHASAYNASSCGEKYVNRPSLSPSFRRSLGAAFGIMRRRVRRCRIRACTRRQQSVPISVGRGRSPPRSFKDRVVTELIISFSSSPLKLASSTLPIFRPLTCGHSWYFSGKKGMEPRRHHLVQ